MRVKIETHAKEEKSFFITCTFYDEDDNGVVPSAARWTLCDMDGNVINGRSDVSVVPTATSETIVLTPTDTTIVSGQNNKRLFLIEFTYDSDNGTGLSGGEEAIFTIDNFKKVP